MRKTIIVLISVISIALFYSCSNNRTQNDHSANEEEIALNNGEKWIVVPEMMAIIRSMESDVNAFEGLGITEHKALAINLQNDIDKLTSNCTMKGQGYDELHKWLLPYLEMVEDYNKADTNEEASLLFKRIKASFQAVNNNFK
ncbi:hypothetical protein OAD66_04145 [Bacteroidia bacterium]|nr:hypothetical protein [Bacteroidia bacterium]